MLLALQGTVRAEPVTLTISCFAGAGFLEACQSGVAAWEKATGNRVTLFYQPEDTTALLTMNQMLLDARSSEVDIFQIDVIWPGLLAEHLLDLAPFFRAEELGRHFPEIVDNNTVNGRLVGIPWFTDAGILYYRKDLLAKYGARPPETWEELAQTAAMIQEAERAAGNPAMVGYVWQGRAYEGLTCNALEWVASHGGGRFVEADGRVSANNPRAIEALDRAAGWLGTITPWEVLFYAELESREVFARGDAIFMRNWPIAWSVVNGPDSAVAGLVGTGALPAAPGERPAAALGGWELAVSKYSKHPTEAVDLIRHLTGVAEQKRRALRWGYSPTYPELYQDEELLSEVPFLADIYRTAVYAVARPSRVTGRHYAAVSSEIWTAVYATLSGNGSAAANLASLQQRLEVIGDGGRW